MPPFTVRRIQAPDCHALRQLVLRPGLPVEASIFLEDKIFGTFHLGVFGQDSGLICVGSFSPQPHRELIAEKSFRLRGMATHKCAQGQGAGATLLQQAFRELEILGCDLLWCHARTSALGFYEKLGMKSHGSEFLNPLGVPHFLMSTRIPTVPDKTLTKKH